MAKSKKRLWALTLFSELAVLAIVAVIAVLGYRKAAAASLWSRKLFLLLLFVFALADLCILFQKTVRKNKLLLLSLSGIAVLASLPLLLNGIHGGHDLDFHLLRIEALSREIRYGNIPVRLSSIYMDGYGYPVSVFYGDLLLYFPAALRLAGFSAVASYKIYVLCINLATALISFACFSKIFENRRIACLCALTYACAAYRLVNIYVRAAVGEYSAMLFLPVIALGFYRIYTETGTSLKHSSKNAFLLAAGMTGLIGTHMLSTEMTVILLLLFCGALLKKTFRKNVLFTWGLAVLETLLLNLYYLVPFLDYYINVPVKVTASGRTTYQIQSTGARIQEYFLFFKNIFGSGTAYEIEKRMLLTPGAVLMAALFAAIVLWLSGRSTKRLRLLTCFSALVLYLASNLFPWDFLAEHFKWANFLSQIQFPWRYLSIAVLLLTLLLGAVLCRLPLQNIRLKRSAACAVLLVNVISAGAFLFSYCAQSELVTYDDTDLNTWSIGEGEYLRAGTDKGALTGEIASENMQSAVLISRTGSKMELFCETNAGGSVEVPMFHYKGFRVRDESGTEYAVTDSANHVIRFELPAQFSGTVTIAFVEPWYWRAAELGSLLTALCLCAFHFIQLIQKRPLLFCRHRDLPAEKTF